MPKKHWISHIFSGVFIFSIALILAEIGELPDLEMLKPKDSKLSFKNNIFGF